MRASAHFVREVESGQVQYRFHGFMWALLAGRDLKPLHALSSQMQSSEQQSSSCRVWCTTAGQPVCCGGMEGLLVSKSSAPPGHAGALPILEAASQSQLHALLSMAAQRDRTVWKGCRSVVAMHHLGDGAAELFWQLHCEIFCQGANRSVFWCRMTRPLWRPGRAALPQQLCATWTWRRRSCSACCTRWS